MQQSRERQGFAMPQEFLQAIAPCAVTSHYRRGATICYARDPADYWYRVAAGVAARSVTFSDGRRQIIELLFRGDFFGFTCSSFQQVDVEAVTDGTTIIRYPRRSVDALVESNPKLESQLRQLAFEAIRRLDDRILLLGRMDALEKVGAFLTEMAERVPHGVGDRIALPLSRYEIADYLGLSMETVSRSISELKRRDAIALHGPHRVKLLDPPALRKERAGSRGTMTEAKRPRLVGEVMAASQAHARSLVESSTP